MSAIIKPKSVMERRRATNFKDESRNQGADSFWGYPGTSTAPDHNDELAKSHIGDLLPDLFEELNSSALA